MFDYGMPDDVAQTRPTRIYISSSTTPGWRQQVEKEMFSVYSVASHQIFSHLACGTAAGLFDSQP